MWRCVPLLVAVSLAAAACSSPPPVGEVGSTLAALSGTVTLDKVISPATVASTALAVPRPGHKISVVVLTVHSPSSSAANFAGIYQDSKLVDSEKHSSIGKREGKYQVTQCATYPTFTTVAAGGSQTGCVLFLLPLAATPVELKISGKAEADFTIAAADIEAGALPAPVVSSPKKVVAPLTEGLGSPSSTPAATTTTSAYGTTTTTVGTGSGSSATPTTVGGLGHVARHHGQSGKAPTINHIDPDGGLVGQKVEIIGKRLSTTTMVTFNGVPATITKRGKTKVVALVPLGATSGPIEVFSPAGNVTSVRTFPVL